MRKIVKLFFTLILIGFTIISSPVMAEETSDPSNEPSTDTTNPTDITDSNTPTESGEEWDGIIKDPVNVNIAEPTVTPSAQPAQPSQSPESPQPTQLKVIEATTKIPSSQAPSNTPRVTTSYTDTNTNTETETIETTEEIKSNPSPEAPTTDTPKSKVKESTNTTPIEVPNTATPNTTRKIALLALISTAIVYFLCIELWGVIKLAKIAKNEKLLKSASEKSAKIKEAKISRAS